MGSGTHQHSCASTWRFNSLPECDSSGKSGTNFQGGSAMWSRSSFFITFCLGFVVCWSSGNAFVSVAVGPGFKSRAGQIALSNDAEMGPANSLHASAQYSEYN